MRRIALSIALVFVLLPAAAQDPPERPTLAVVGLLNEVDNEEWQDVRIGMGVRALLSQLFFESGEFDLLEEKQEIREQIQALSTGIWSLGSDPVEAAEAELGALQPDYLAYGKVVYFGRPRTRINIGPMRRNVQATQIRVEVTLLEVATGDRITKKGSGVSRTTANSAFFVFQEDRVAFDESNVGNATKEALAEAVGDVMASAQKSLDNRKGD